MEVGHIWAVKLDTAGDLNSAECTVVVVVVVVVVVSEWDGWAT